MKKKNENDLVRINAVSDVCESYKAMWQSSDPFGECVADLLHLKTKIDTERSLIEKSTEGVTKAKRNAETALIRMAFSISAGLAAFAVRSKNEVLLAEVNFKKSDFELMRNNKLIATGRMLVAEAQKHTDVLSGYQVTPDDVAQLEAAIANFEALVPAPQRSIGDNKMKREDLDDLFKQANTLMRDVMDRMIVPYESKAPEFYRAYQNARKSVKLGIRHNDDDENAPDSNIAE